MYYDTHKRSLMASNEKVIKKMHCPYPEQPSLTYKDQRTLQCKNCVHNILVVHEHTEKELRQVVEKNSQTCLLVDPRFVRCI